MGGISSSGIVSGIDTASIIEQLLQIEARPKILAQQRILTLQTQQAAYLDVNSSLLSLRTTASSLRVNRLFKSAKATSSHPDILTATASSSASPGSYSFVVNRLVATEQQITRGFVSHDTGGLGASSFTFEVGGGQLSRNTRLSELNGAQGVERGRFRIIDAAGNQAEIDVSTAVNVNDVLDAINTASGVNIRASIDGDRLKLEDLSGGAGTFRVENAFGYNTAASLGLLGTDDDDDGVILGENINRISGFTALSALNDGSGVNIRTGVAFDFKITDKDGQAHSIRLGQLTDSEGVVTRNKATTLQDVIDAIEEDTGGAVTASVGTDGVSLVLTDNTGGSGALKVEEAGAGRDTAAHLGILGETTGGQLEGRRLLAGINTSLVSSLNGGAGLTDGEFIITDRFGNATTITFDTDGTVQDILDAINNSGTGLTAELNQAGNGIAITVDPSAGRFTLSGAAADQLGLTGVHTEGAANSGNLQTRYISGATTLASVNAGQGVGTGKFKITDSRGVSFEVEVNSSIKTFDDLIKKINDRPNFGVKASINAQGDGLLLEDTSGTGQAIIVEDIEGTVAKRLNIAGTAEGTGAGENRLDGSFERTVNFEATDTLQQVVDKINAEGVGVAASVINDGGGAAPYRISFTSRTSGTAGRVSIDTGDLDLGLTTLTAGRDAVVFYGSSDPARAVALTSSTNSLDNVIPGVTIDLNGTSSAAVEVVVGRDIPKIEEGLNGFVDGINAVFDAIDQYDSYNAETKQRGALLGDSTILNLRQALLRVVQGPPTQVEGRYQRLYEVGIRIGEGARIEFDRDKFRQAYETDPAAVEALIAAYELAPTEDEVLLEDENGNPIATTPATGGPQPRVLGIAELVKQLADNYTNSIDGALTRRRNSLNDQIDLQNERIRFFDTQLARKRSRLEQQFLQMERLIAGLQSQQSALASLG